MHTRNSGVKEYEAWKILAEINRGASIGELQGMDWSRSGAMSFLTGKTETTVVQIAEPLTEEQATQAIKEYREQGYR